MSFFLKSDWRDLDQPTQLGDDWVGRTSLDQPDDTGGDRCEALSSEVPRLSYATDDSKKGDPSGQGSPVEQSGNGWRAVKKRKRVNSRQLEASEVEGDLLATTGSDNEGVHNARFFHQSFDGEGNNLEGRDEREPA